MSETIVSQGLDIRRVFTVVDVSPFDEIDWKRTDAVITDPKGNTIFEQKNVEVPATWSDTATKIVASKYFHGAGETRENSVRQLVTREVETITGHGWKTGYFASEEDASAFKDELAFLILNQFVSFNSPVNFNVGKRGHLWFSLLRRTTFFL